MGLASKRGLFAYRDINAVYTAYRIQRILADHDASSGM